MSDIVDKQTRSRMMSGIRSRDTSPELIIRKGLFRRGFRYRLHVGNLPGKPDLVLPRYNAIILVNGCFWHGHDCHLFKWPKSRESFWRKKIGDTKRRDSDNLRRYREMGWRVATVWECSVRDENTADISNKLEILSEWLHGNSQSLDMANISYWR